MNLRLSSFKCTCLLHNTSHENVLRITQAPFTRVRTNFCTGAFCSWTACLHGSMKILLQIAVVFTWVRANFKTSRFCFVLLLLLSNQANNITRFQTLTSLSVQKFARFGCLHESVRNRNRAGQKVDLLFSGPKLAHLAVQKFVQIRRSRVNARRNRASFFRAKICPRPCKRGLSVQVWDLKKVGQLFLTSTVPIAYGLVWTPELCNFLLR